jgi:hypothetical protein
MTHPRAEKKMKEATTSGSRDSMPGVLAMIESARGSTGKENEMRSRAIEGRILPLMSRRTESMDDFGHDWG